MTDSVVLTLEFDNFNDLIPIVVYIGQSDWQIFDFIPLCCVSKNMNIIHIEILRSRFLEPSHLTLCFTGCSRTDG